MHVADVSVKTGFVSEAVVACELVVDAICECGHIDEIEHSVPCPVVTMAQVVNCVVLRFAADGTVKAKLVLPCHGYWFCKLDPFLLNDCLNSRGIELELVVNHMFLGDTKHGSIARAV